MDMPQLERPQDCQLQLLCQAGTKPTHLDRFSNLVLRLRRPAGRLFAVIRVLASRPSKSSGQLAQIGPGLPNLAPSSQPVQAQDRRPFAPGDWVYVRSWKDIEATLDSQGTFDGLRFMDGMRYYCDRRLKVFKRAETIFDERRWKVVRLRNTVLLEGALCDGTFMSSRAFQICHRSCFYFWKAGWLRPEDEEV